MQGSSTHRANITAGAKDLVSLNARIASDVYDMIAERVIGKHRHKREKSHFPSVARLCSSGAINMDSVLIPSRLHRF